MKPLAKSVLILLTLSAVDTGIYKKIIGQGVDNINNFKQRNERYPGKRIKGVKINTPGRGAMKAGEGAITASQGRGAIRADQDF